MIRLRRTMRGLSLEVGRRFYVHFRVYCDRYAVGFDVSCRIGPRHGILLLGFKPFGSLVDVWDERQDD